MCLTSQLARPQVYSLSIMSVPHFSQSVEPISLQPGTLLPPALNKDDRTLVPLAALDSIADKGNEHDDAKNGRRIISTAGIHGHANWEAAQDEGEHRVRDGAYVEGHAEATQRELCRRQRDARKSAVQ